MSSPDQPEATPEELAARLWANMWPETKLWGGAMVGLGILPVLLFALLTQTESGGGAFFLIVLMMVSIWGAGFCFFTLRRSRTLQVMRRIAPALGLQYDNEGWSLLGRIPMGLLPSGNEKKGGDHLSGRIGDRGFDLCEVTIQRTSGSGKNRSTHTVFKGVVLRYVMLADLPALQIEAGRPGSLIALLFAGNQPLNGNVDEEIDRLLKGQTHRHNEAVRLLVRALTRLPRIARGNAKLTGVRLRDKELFVALSIPGDLFDIGAFIWSERVLALHIRDTYADIRMLFDMVSELLEAESAISKLRQDGSGAEDRPVGNHPVDSPDDPRPA